MSDIKTVAKRYLASLVGAKLIAVDRDSVAAGDDVNSHKKFFIISEGRDIKSLVAAALCAAPLPSIQGGEATWIVYLIEHDKKFTDLTERPIAVIAQQWGEPKFLTDSSQMLKNSLSSVDNIMVYFKYWLQSDPAAVLTALRCNSELPPRS